MCHVSSTIKYKQIKYYVCSWKSNIPLALKSIRLKKKNYDLSHENHSVDFNVLGLDNKTHILMAL